MEQQKKAIANEKDIESSLQKDKQLQEQRYQREQKEMAVKYMREQARLSAEADTKLNQTKQSAVLAQQ